MLKAKEVIIPEEQVVESGNEQYDDAMGNRKKKDTVDKTNHEDWT